MEKIKDMIEHSKIELLNQEVSNLSVKIFDALTKFKDDGVITEEEFKTLRRDPSKLANFYYQRGFTNRQINKILEQNKRRLDAIEERKVLRDNAEEEMEKEYKIIDSKINALNQDKAKCQRLRKKETDATRLKLLDLRIKNDDLNIANCLQYKEIVKLNHSDLVSDDLYEIAETKRNHRGHEYAYARSFIDDKIRANNKEINENRKAEFVYNELLKARKTETEEPKEEVKIETKVPEEKSTAMVAKSPVYKQVKDSVRNIYMYKNLLGKKDSGLNDEDIKRYIATYEDTIKELRGENNKYLSNAEMQKIYSEIMQEEYVVNNLGKGAVSKKEEDVNTTTSNDIHIDVDKIFADYYENVRRLRSEDNENSNDKPASKTNPETVKKEQSTNNTGSNNNHIDVNKIFADYEERVRKLRGEDDSSNSFFVTDEEINSAGENSNNTHQQPEVNATSNDNDYDLDAAILIAQNKLNELLKEKRAREAKNQAKNETPSNSNSKSSQTNKQEDKPKSNPQAPATKETNKKNKDVKKFKDPEDSIDEDEIKIIKKEKINKKDSRFRKLLRKYKKQIAAGLISLALLVGGVVGYNFGKNNNKDLDTEKNKVDDTTQVEETVNPTASAASDKAQATPTPSPVQTDENGDYHINEEDLYKNSGEPVVVPSPPAQEKEPSTQANRPEGYNNDDFNSSANTNSNAQVTAVSNNENKPVTGVSTVATSVNNVNKSFAVDEGTTSSYSSSGGVNSSFATGDNASSSTSSSNSSFATDDNNTSYANNVTTSDSDLKVQNQALYDYFVGQTSINESLLNGNTVVDYSADSVLGDDIEAIRAENGSDQDRIENAIAKSKYLLNIKKEDLTEEQLAEFASLSTNLSEDQYYKLCVDTITLTGYSNTNHENYTKVLNDTIKQAVETKVPTKTLGRI